MRADVGLVFVIELLSDGGQLPAFEVSDFDGAPPLSGARESAEYQLHDGLFAEGIRDDFEASALLDKQALEKIRGPDRAAMRHRETQVSNASFEVVHEACSRALVIFAVISHHPGGEFACDRSAGAWYDACTRALNSGQRSSGNLAAKLRMRWARQR